MNFKLYLTFNLTVNSLPIQRLKFGCSKQSREYEKMKYTKSYQNQLKVISLENKEIKICKLYYCSLRGMGTVTHFSINNTQ